MKVQTKKFFSSILKVSLFTCIEFTCRTITKNIYIPGYTGHGSGSTSYKSREVFEGTPRKGQ